MPSDSAICRDIVRRHARTFHLASGFLPAAKRRGAFALYAFCRVVDDAVDTAGSIAEARTALAERERRLHRALAGHSDDAVFRELARAVAEFQVPPDTLFELVAGVSRDLVPVRYATWDELARYCEGVASTVGEMCTYVFGVAGGAASRERALRYARALGIAMQLTNILRDVGEDARRGRCYLPDEDLALFALSRDEVLSNPSLASDERWRPFMAYEIGRARMLYEGAIPGISLLAADARRCATACAVGYAGILDAIERADYDTIGRRARLAITERLGVLWRALRAPRADRFIGGGPMLPGLPLPRLAPHDELLQA